MGVVVILTDGQDNSSRLHTQQSLFSIIARLKARGWNFIFLAANMDAIRMAQYFGIAKGAALTFAASANGQAEVYRAASASVYRSRMQGGKPSEFTVEERQRSLAR